MTETLIKKVETDSTTRTVEVLTPQEKEWVKIQGKLTSKIRTRKSTNIPYYSFLWIEDCVDCHNVREICQSLTLKHRNCEECQEQRCQECEIPVIFRLSSQQKPNLNKGKRVLLEENWAESKKLKTKFHCLLLSIIKRGENISRYE